MNEVSPQEAQHRVQQGAMLIDVREPHEYDEVHAAGARLMPLSSFEELAQDLPKDAELIMICRSGARSERAGQYLLSQGYGHVSNLQGGTLAWVAGGLPTGDAQSEAAQTGGTQ